MSQTQQQDKTEEATPQKLRKARKEGKYPVLKILPQPLLSLAAPLCSPVMRTGSRQKSVD